ncbi:hypothetical protein GN244_ATG00223 [Phytophthora infestans]|uniref:M96 mating-specific protein family n=1 Tax=Phytophthora infestans TaxID=4787 RepID=A0A833WQM8_PHYIN|nr:hypothetical protein GN244_ATG00223 [Phytophthora infestans]KAF4131422.1 hypothetical protein GN958_ATG19366 [Phytophthora infestans]
MAFLQDEDAAFEAALSFLDEFGPGAAVADDPLHALNQGASLPKLGDAQGSSNSNFRRQEVLRDHHRAHGRQQLTEEEKKRRKAEFNERRRKLRKAGVYGNANRARNERAQEIAYQREQLGRLQIDLQILQTRRVSKPCNQERAAESNKTTLDSQITILWQELAAQQRRRREEAERDNVLLRLAVERQRKVASTLQSQTKRRATQLQNNFNVLDFHGDMESFRGLFQRLDDAYQTMDAVFMENGLAGMAVPPVEVHVHECRNGKFVELVSYKMLPFDVCSTAEATWKHFKGVEKHLANGSLYEKAEKGLDEPYTIIADFKKEVYAIRSRADIKVKQVIRRYVEEDRDVVLWVSRAVPIEIKHKLLRGLTYHLQGYAVTKRSPESTPDREASVLQFCYVVSLDHHTDMRCNASNLDVLFNFLVTTTAQNIRAHRELIENALIDRSLHMSAISQYQLSEFRGEAQAKAHTPCREETGDGGRE